MNKALLGVFMTNETNLGIGDVVRVQSSVVGYGEDILFLVNDNEQIVGASDGDSSIIQKANDKLLRIKEDNNGVNFDIINDGCTFHCVDGTIARVIDCDAKICIVEFDENARRYFAEYQSVQDKPCECCSHSDEMKAYSAMDYYVNTIEESFEYDFDIEQEPTQEKKKEETQMFSENRNGLNFGGKVTDGRFRLSINGLAVRNKEGKYVTYNAKVGNLTEVQNGFFDQLNDLLFYMPTMELEVGDVILHQEVPYFVTELVSDSRVKAINYENMTEDVLVPTENMFGQKFYVKVFNCLGTNNILGSGLTANPMMAYMLMGEKDLDISKLMMLQSMQGNDGVTDFSGQPWMMMALMGKEGNGNMNDFMKMSMLAQMNKAKAEVKKPKENANK